MTKLLLFLPALCILLSAIIVPGCFLCYFSTNTLPAAAGTDLDEPQATEVRSADGQRGNSTEEAVATEGLRINPLQLNYPKDGQEIKASSTFLIGAVAPKAMLTCNGVPIKVNSSGFFAHVVRLKPGLNSFSLVSDSQPAEMLKVTVTRPVDPAILPSHPLMFAMDFIEPHEDLGVTPGDLIGFAIRGTPGSTVEIYLGRQKIRLTPAATKGNCGNLMVKRKVEVAYGLSTTAKPSNLPDLYSGFYRVTNNDHWQRIRPRFVLAKGKRTITHEAPCHLYVIEQPVIAETLHQDTVTRLGPGQARTTPLDAGVRLLVDGWQGTSMRCALAPGQHIWIAKEDLVFKKGATFVPLSGVRTVNIQEDKQKARILIPLSQRLPYQIEQRSKQLILRIFGATSDTDWITEVKPPSGKRLIDHVTWRQPSDQVYELVVTPTFNRQWGFWASYEGTNLILNVKAPPQLHQGLNPLSGLTVCLDPGHGGQEKGAVGPSGVSESEINLAIAVALKRLLENEGASVIMTRESNLAEPSLINRVKLAINSGANLLISIHNNALPDGRDPWAEHGTSTYWYHLQSLELAKTLKAHLVTELGFPDFGTFYQNLALARPSQLPAVLVEVGFMIHPDEYAQLLSQQIQQRAAKALLKGIKDYVVSAKTYPNAKLTGD
ncbi:MAG: N-acetylmuramoyl-L-alanine amidase [Candidatus Melainabacteria bacterium]|nr:N-acetylmuramoyl-L-alanine amidase [Candidatus Melainabacteria bacterium]